MGTALNDFVQSTSAQITAKGIWDDSDACTEIDCESDPNSSKALSVYLDELLSDGLYINIHTTTFPSGEIRGQIESVPEPTSLLALVGISSLIGLKYSKNK
ncbi:MAG: CHRD domain-containing protein [Crocosphaera sp.]